MKQIYTPQILLLCFVFAFLGQSCSRDPKPQFAVVAQPEETTSVEEMSNLITATTDNANSVTNAETTSSTIVADPVATTATDVVAISATSNTPLPPEKVKDGASLRAIADKIATAKKEGKTAGNEAPKNAIIPNQPENEVSGSIAVIEPQGEKPTEMNVVVTQQPERATASAVAVTDNRASMVFDQKEFSFGVIVTGKVVEHDFSFVNKGSVPLVIYDASSTCGCTIPEYPQEPVMPGERGVIKVTYDSKGKIGTQDKPVTLKTNAGTHVIHLKGAVFTENMMKEDGQ